MKIFSESLNIKVKPEKAFWNNITNFRLIRENILITFLFEKQETERWVLEKSDLLNKQHLILKFYTFSIFLSQKFDIYICGF